MTLYLLSYALLILAGGYIWRLDREQQQARHERDKAEALRRAEAQHECTRGTLSAALSAALVGAEQQRQHAEKCRGEVTWQALEIVLLQSELDRIRDRYLLLPTLDGVRAEKRDGAEVIALPVKGGAL